MFMNQALRIVVLCLKEETGTIGIPQDRPIVQQFLDGGDRPDTHAAAYVAGVPLSHYYINNLDLSNRKDSLWQCIEQSANAGTILEPNGWDINLRLGQIALYLEAHAQTAPMLAAASASTES